MATLVDLMAILAVLVFLGCIGANALRTLYEYLLARERGIDYLFSINRFIFQVIIIPIAAIVVAAVLLKGVKL